MQALAELHQEMRCCRRCLEAGYPITPGAVLSEVADARLVLIGQAPGVIEAETKRPFCGPSGRRLFQWLEQAGWEEEEFRRTQYMAAMTRCYPGKGTGGHGDRVPTPVEQELCAPFLEHELALLRPQIILLVGRLAVRRFLGSARLADVVGRVFQGDTTKTIPHGPTYVPLPHPSGVSLWLNRPENQALVVRACEQIRRLSEDLGLHEG